MNETEEILKESPDSIFAKEIMAELVTYEVNSSESLEKVSGLIDSFKEKIKTLNSYINIRKEAMESFIGLAVKNGSDLDSWEGKQIRVDLYDYRINVLFMFNILEKKYSKAEIELEIADKDAIFNWDGKIRPEMEGKNIELYDVCKVRFPSFSVNLCNGDKPEEAEAMKVCNYIGKEFYKKDTSDRLMETIKGFYIELSSLWEKREYLITSLHVLRSKKDSYCLELCTKEARNMNLFSLDNADKIVMIFSKASEFIEFEAYTIKSVRNKYMTVDAHRGKFDFTYKAEELEDGNYRHYLKIKTEDYDFSFEKEKFIELVGKKLFKESKVEIYTQDDFDNLCLMYNTQRMDICNDNKLPDYLKEVCENYARIVTYQKENYHLL